MTQEQFDELTKELIHYTLEIGDGKNFEVNDIEIKMRIQSLNEQADFALDNDDTEAYKTLCFFAYQYYRLYYG